MNTRGQTALEVAMMIPLFMVFAFLSLELGHIGIGIAIVNYAASSVARQAVAENSYNQGDADTKFNNILFAGLQSKGIHGNTEQDGVGTSNLTVIACADIPSFPLVAPFIDKALKTGSSPAPGGCTGASKWVGPVGIEGPPTYRFLIQGQSVARMNYNAGK